MHRLMLRPRMQVKQCAIPAQFSGDQPFVGHLVPARHMGNVLSGNASPHDEAKNASEPIGFSQPVLW